MSNRPVRILVTTIMIVAVCGLAGAQTEPLRGTVVNKADKGLKEVRIVLRAPTGGEAIEEIITDDDGKFSIPMESLRPGYELHLHKDGYDDVALPINPQQLVVANIRVIMQPSRVEAPPKPASAKAIPTPIPSTVTPAARKRAVALYNKGVETWEEGKSAEDAKEREEQQAAMQMIRQSASLDPTFAEPLIMLSRLALKNQNWAEASRYSEDLIRIDPNDIDAVRTLYLCMVIMRHHHRIGEAALRLATLDPETIPSIEEHAQTYFTNEIYVMAKAMYEALTEFSLDPATAYLGLGMSSANLGDLEGTRAAFTKFLEIAHEDDPRREAVEHDLADLEPPKAIESPDTSETPE